MKQILSATVLILVFSLAGCAKPPTEEMNNAIEAVTRAENDADAAQYAGNSLARAKDALDRMKGEADSKRYDAAKTYAAEAVSAAEKAIADGKVGAARARSEADALVKELRPVIDETGQGIRAAQSSNLPLDYAELNRDFDTARSEADQADAALSRNKYQEAVDKSKSARAGLNGINQKLSNAATATSRKK